jgi:hypothetical protein
LIFYKSIYIYIYLIGGSKMALNAKNILVGASPLYLSTKDSTNAAYEENMLDSGTIAFTKGANASAALDLSSDVRNVGFTNNGLQITYNPSYGSVTVDQLLDTAKLFKESMEVMIATEMAEGTLENVLAVFGQGAGTRTGALAKGVSAQANVDETLGLEAGALGVAPTERQLFAVGNAPTVVGPDTERVYYARCVLSVQQSQFSLARNAATTFPVTFRLLPDGNYIGSEYGKIIDRVTKN